MGPHINSRSGLPVFQDFYKAAERAFGFLASKGFEMKREPASGHGASLVLSSSERLVRVHFEHLSRPWVVIRDLTGKGGKEVSLEKEIKQRLPDVFAELDAKDIQSEYDLGILAKGYRALFAMNRNIMGK